MLSSKSDAPRRRALTASSCAAFSSFIKASTRFWAASAPNRGIPCIIGCFGLGPCLLYLQGRLAHDVFARGAEDDFAVVLLILQRAAKERSTGVERRDDIFEIAARVVVIEFVKSSQVE